MSETHDRRRRTDLDLFVLALIESGISTPYRLQKAASLSQGATIPALQRLLEAGFVAQEKAGLRGRTDYKITSHGKTALKDGWRPLVQDGPTGDLDSDLRVALLAFSVGKDRRTAAEFLRQSSIAKEASLAIGHQEETVDVTPLARWYSLLRLRATRTLLEAESAAARNMAAALPRTLSHKSKLRSRSTKAQADTL